MQYIIMNEIKVKKVGRKPTNKAAFDMIAQLKQGEQILLKPEQWKLKTKPGRHIIRNRTGREVRVETLLDETGWLCTALN